MSDTAAVIETDIPARLDRLPWASFHTLVVIALGITWILDGLEVTLAGSVAGALQESPVLHFSVAEVGLVGTAYLVGAVTGAVVFGYLTDRLGRRRLFFVTLGLYLVTDRFAGNLLELADFVVGADRPSKDFTPYHTDVRGIVALKAESTVAAQQTEVVA